MDILASLSEASDRLIPHVAIYHMIDDSIMDAFEHHVEPYDETLDLAEKMLNLLQPCQTAIRMLANVNNGSRLEFQAMSLRRPHSIAFRGLAVFFTKTIQHRKHDV